jgi:YD repeat-containing protein
MRSIKKAKAIMKSIVLLCLAVARIVVLFGCLCEQLKTAPTSLKSSLAALLLRAGLLIFLMCSSACATTSGPSPATADARAAAAVAGDNLTAIHNGLHATCLANGFGNACGSRNPTYSVSDEAATKRVKLNFCITESVNSGSGLTCNADYFLYCARSGYAVIGGSCVPSVYLDNTKNPQKQSLCIANPIYPLTGAKKEFLGTGVSLGGLQLSLTYDTTSKLPANQADTLTLVERNSFGALWKSNYHHQLEISATLKSALLSRGDGFVLNFSGNGSGAFTATADHAHKLVSVTGGYLFTDAVSGTLETFDAAGKLLGIASVNGALLSFSYDGENLTQVQSGEGRSVRFTYDANGLVSRVTGPDGGITAAAYDANKNLISLTWPDGKVQGFLYENAGLPWALTGKQDENNSRYATFVYDNQGRATSSEHAGAVEKFTVSYAAPAARVVTDNFDSGANILYRSIGWSAPAGTSYIQPNGQAIAADAKIVGGMPAFTGQSQPAGSGCAASVSAVSYDSSGNVLSRDDFQANRSCYGYDGSNRETVRVEGLANTASCAGVTPANAALATGARRITTTWHPDWGMAAQVVQPLRKTTTVHHGQPDPFNGNDIANCTSATLRADGKALPLVCKQVDQVLLGDNSIDLTVAASINQYTYDSAGRLMSRMDPSGHTTAYAYFADTAVIGAYDAYFENVSLLLHGNGSNGQASIVDASLSHRAVVANGNAQLTTTQSRFGGASMLFDGSGDYASLVHDWVLEPNSDYTLEGWIRPSAVTGVRAIACKRPSVAFSGFQFLVNGGKLDLYVAGSGSVLNLVGSTAVAPNAYQHVAFVRSGNVFYLFLGGHLEGSGAISGNYVESSDALLFGRCQPNFSWDFNGAMDEIRITKGVARYTANFTPPGQEFAQSGPAVDSVGHTTGDLQSVTNAAGHVTQFTLYDRAGRVKQMVDPKGVVTDTQYTPRGWTSSVTVTPPGGTARTTSYTYDNAGQMTGAALPDGTTLGYSYDAAHRLTGVIDAKGNSVTYTLDNAGNKTGEQVKDPSGNLQRNITRVYDALNRVQQITGASN